MLTPSVRTEPLTIGLNVGLGSPIRVKKALGDSEAISDGQKVVIIYGKDIRILPYEE